jgi:hypothetical protein
MTRQTIATSTAATERLALIRSLWGEILCLDAVSDDVNFFDAGGDSLLLVALVERIRQSTGLPVRTVDVLRAATVRGQAALVANSGETSR